MVLTLMEMAHKGQEIPVFTLVAQNEQMNVQLLMERVATGRIVIPYNSHHKPQKPQGFGLGLCTKVSASIGLVADEDSLTDELLKVDEAIRAGTNAIMDLIEYSRQYGRGKADYYKKGTVALGFSAHLSGLC